MNETENIAWAGRRIPPRSLLAARRALFEAKTIVAKYPRVALPVARRRHGSAVDGATEIVIEGFPRSGMSFAVVAFEMSQTGEVRVASHVHAPAQVKAAVRRHIPALVLIREPESTILSFAIRHPHVPMRQALRGYVRFYLPLLRYSDGFLVGGFHDVITDFGAVTRKVNDRFGTSFGEFSHTPRNVERCFAQISDGYRASVGESTRFEQIVARPSAERDRIKEALRAKYREPRLAGNRDRAESIYAAFAALCD